MNQITIYKILSFILLPFAVYFSFSSLASLLMGFTSPVFLIITFIIICFPIYTFSCLIFLFKGISGNHPCKASLKDWIRVNGIGAFILGILIFISGIVIITIDKVTLYKAVENMLAQQSFQTTKENTAKMANNLKVGAFVMIFFSIILGIHHNMTFSLLKKYQHLFGGGQQ